MLPGFRDAGPRRYTHLSADFLPLRLDRCLVRGLACTGTAVLPRGGSDHKPIMMHLDVHAHASEIRQQQADSRVA